LLSVKSRWYTVKAMNALTAPSAPETTGTATATAENPVLQLTPGAVAQVKQVIAQQGFEGYFLAVRVVPAGCSGLGYDLNLVKESKPGDQVWTQDGISLTTDALSVKYLAGTVVDYQKSDTAAGFKFQNPNAKSSCGCGTSFSA
jgi:iron-sulfur cluster assembly accessory protein